MDKNNYIEDEAALYTRIDKSIKERMTVYITNSKLTGKKETSTQRKLVEIAVHEYLVNHPIPTDKPKETQEELTV